MREKLETLILVVGVGSSVAIAAKRLGVPYNVALVVVGLVLVFLDFLPFEPLDPQVVLVAFLPILVFESALASDAEGLRRASKPILALALPGVAISLLATGGVATWALGLPFSAALLLGALLAITDTVSVLLAFKSVRVPHRLAAIMEGESLFNDGTALVLVALTTAVVARGTFDPTATAHALLLAIVGGGALGAAFGVLGSVVLRRTPDHLTAILASIVLVFATSLVAERIHASPIIAVVVAGLLVGRAAREALAPSIVLALSGFWETIGFVLNVFMFLLVGMQIQAGMLFEEAVPIGLAVLALHAGRAVAVYGSFGLLRATFRERVPMRWQHVMVLGNIKGALSMAAVLALPSDLPHRPRLVTIVFGVTFVTLVTQALPFRRVLTWLKVVVAPVDPTVDRAKARLIAARRGQAELDELLSAGLVSRRDHAEHRARFQRSVIEAEGILRSPRAAAGHDEVVDVALLLGRKAALVDAARRGLVGEAAAAAEIDEIDRALLEREAHEGETT